MVLELPLWFSSSHGHGHIVRRLIAVMTGLAVLGYIYRQLRREYDAGIVGAIISALLLATAATAVLWLVL